MISVAMLSVLVVLGVLLVAGIFLPEAQGSITTIYPVQLARVHLTSAQLLSLPHTLIPAPGGPGQMIIPISATWVYTAGPSTPHPNQGTATLGADLAFDWNTVSPINGPLSSTGQGATGSWIQSETSTPLASLANQPFQIEGNLNAGPILTTSLGSGGSGYAVNDQGVIDQSSNTSARYKVLSTGAGGAIVTYSLLSAGNGYLPASGVADVPGGPITSSSLGAGGSGYAPGDTGTVSGAGSADATYTVNTVNGGGAVLTYTLTSQGTNYSAQSGVSTTVSTGGGNGAFTVNVLSDAGSGATFNILTVTEGNGSLDVVIAYYIAQF